MTFRRSSASACPACGAAMPCGRRMGGLRRLCCDACWKRIPTALRRANQVAVREFRAAAGDMAARRFAVGRIDATAQACLDHLSSLTQPKPEGIPSQ